MQDGMIMTSIIGKKLERQLDQKAKSSSTPVKRANVSVSATSPVHKRAKKSNLSATTKPDQKCKQKTVSFAAGTAPPAPSPTPTPSQGINRLSRSRKGFPKKKWTPPPPPSPNDILFQVPGCTQVQSEDPNESIIIGNYFPANDGKDYPFLPPSKMASRLVLAARICPELAGEHVQKANFRYRRLNGNKISDTAITHKIGGDGNCLFRAISFLLTGEEHQHHLIRAKIIERIAESHKDPDDPVKLYLGKEDGRDYLKRTNMGNFGKWGTDFEIFTCAQILECDIFVYTRTVPVEGVESRLQWQRFPYRAPGSLKELRNGMEAAQAAGVVYRAPEPVYKEALYLDNTTGYHYDAVIGFNSQ
jgi:hypothetical protein